MFAKKLRQNPGRLRAIVYAVLVHAVVIGLAFIGFRWTVDSPSSEQVVQATAITEAPPVKKPEEDKRARQEELEREKAEAEKRRQEELKRKQEEEQEQQRLLIERKKKEAEEKEKQKRAAEEQRKKEKEAQRKQEELRRQKLAEETLQQQLAAEEQVRQQAAQSARAATEIDKYRLLIRQRVSRSWNRPLGVAPGLKCVVRVHLTPGGEVLSAKVVTSSGNPVFDRSVENAVFKAAPLPLPEDPSLFDNFREIEFLFSPEE